MDKQMSDLKPCPFCGSDSLTDGGGNVFGTYLRCANCGIHGPARDGLAAAIVAWNSQAAYAAGVAAAVAVCEERAQMRISQANKQRPWSSAESGYRLAAIEAADCAAAIRARGLTKEKQMPEPLISLEEHNARRLDAYARLEAAGQPHANGIACPTCGSELWDTDPRVTFSSNPPKKHVHCPICDYKGYAIK